MPNVVNLSVEEAEYDITSNNLEVNIKYETSDVVPDGIVIRQFPEGDEELERDAVITIIVSSGLNEK